MATEHVNALWQRTVPAQAPDERAVLSAFQPPAAETWLRWEGRGWQRRAALSPRFPADRGHMELSTHSTTLSPSQQQQHHHHHHHSRRFLPRHLSLQNKLLAEMWRPDGQALLSIWTNESPEPSRGPCQPPALDHSRPSLFTALSSQDDTQLDLDCDPRSPKRPLPTHQPSHLHWMATSTKIEPRGPSQSHSAEGGRARESRHSPVLSLTPTSTNHHQQLHILTHIHTATTIHPHPHRPSSLTTMTIHT
ncbi:hypothetical protein V8E36_000329 [Tilletia maclaganii]